MTLAEQLRPTVSGQVFVDAPADEVYRLVGDPVAMVAFSEEVRRVRLLDGATRVKVGTRFRGDNRNGRHRWWTIATVVEEVEGRSLAYEVRTPFFVPIAQWRYDVEPSGTGCVVTESMWMRVPRWFGPIANLITGEPDRLKANRAHIASTLGRLKRHVESSVRGR